MNRLGTISVFSFLTLLPASTFAAGFITPAVSVGRNLETESRIALSEAAPKGGISVQVSSADPARVLLSHAEEAKGEASITVQIAEGARSSPEFHFHGLGDSGSVKYVVTAPGFDTGNGEVTLTPSGILIKGPGSLGSPVRTTPRAWPAKFQVLAGQFDPSGELIGTQKVRGGFILKVKLSSSNASVATTGVDELSIAGGEFAAGADVKTLAAGTAELIATAAALGDSPRFNRLSVDVIAPSISILDEMHLGNNLQINTALTLGEPAPEGGVKVTLTSKDPSRLMLAAGPFDKGAPSVVITVPAGASSAPYSVHGMAADGDATYTASAPGFRGREATLPLVPSGVIITGPTGMPDEIEVLRPEMPVSPNGFFAKAAGPGNEIHVLISTVRLDPKTLRAADITAQLLRADLKLKVMLRNDNPELGQFAHPYVVIEGGKGQGGSVFVPNATGTGNLTFETPAGFTRPSNCTDLKSVVQ